jgi:hypothetical protein
VKKRRKKKNRRVIPDSKKSPKDIEPQASSLPPRQSLLQLVRTHPYWVVASSLIAFVALSIGVISGLADILGGPLWPTPPTFSPGLPSSSSPLAVPFDVTNKSSLFDIQNLKIDCGLIGRMENDVGGVLSFGKGDKPAFITISDAFNWLPAGSTRSYTCPFAAPWMMNGMAHPKIQFLQMILRINFDPHWWVKGPIDVTFALDTLTSPPQWKAGSPLK